MAKKQFCQGDLMFELENKSTSADQLHGIAQLSSRAVIDGRIVIEEGEKTGHAHTVDQQDALLYQLFVGQEVLVVSNTTQVTHDEHEPLTLQPGTYNVRRQRSFDYEAEANRERKFFD